AEGQTRAHGTFRVALVRRGPSEVDEQAVAHVLPHVSTDTAQHLHGAPLVGAHDVAEVLGVEARGELRGSDEIAEEDAELPALPFRGARDARRQGVRPGKAARRMRLLRIDHAERLEERLDRDVAPLEPLLGDPVQEPPETTATDRRRDRHGLRAELLDDDLVHRLAAYGRLTDQALEQD